VSSLAQRVRALEGFVGALKKSMAKFEEQDHETDVIGFRVDVTSNDDDPEIPDEFRQLQMGRACKKKGKK
jgi:hypothetical protein